MKRNHWMMAALALLVTTNAWAGDWRVFISAQVIGIVQWQKNCGLLLEVVPRNFCYVPANEMTALALITALYRSGRYIDIHRHATSMDMGGMSTHRSDRIIAQ